MTVKAPKGYKIKCKNGVFTLSSKGRYAQFMSFRSPLHPPATGDVILSGVKAKSVKGEKEHGDVVQGNRQTKGRPVRDSALTSSTESPSSSSSAARAGQRPGRREFRRATNLPIASTAR